MAKAFDIPDFYRANLISRVKKLRQGQDQRKRDETPTLIDLGVLRIKLARHFGFCYGVQNAIEIAYRALAENPGKRIFLLSEMIHNPQVNADLAQRGIRFLQTTDGEVLTPFSELRAEDIVIVPAFGTTVEIFKKLEGLGINPQTYNTTCPFVEKVWKRSEQLGQRGYTVIIHGKHTHEETRATFSHARQNAASLMLRDLHEAGQVAQFIRGSLSEAAIRQAFAARVSPGFDFAGDLLRIGVVNQTTMLAEETQAISDLLRQAMLERYGAPHLGEHFADTRDTLCYATSENQGAVGGLISAGADLALVVGGYNSSNTSHLVEMLSEHMPTYYINDAQEIISARNIRSLDLATNALNETPDWIPSKRPLEVAVSAGASCPDAVVEAVLTRLAGLFDLSEGLRRWESEQAQALS